MTDDVCPGCGARRPTRDGPAHPYIGASPACWARYGELLARDYGDLGMPDVHRLAVHAYAVQHPGVPGPQAIRSVCLHLVGLHLVIERGVPAAREAALWRRLAERPPASLRWLDPPAPNGTLTVEHVLAAGLEEHDARVREWAEDVWSAWAPHHDVVRGWAPAG